MADGWRGAWRAALICGLAGTLIGCSWSSAGDPLAPQPSAACALSEPTPAADPPADLVPGLALDTRSDQASFIHTTTPVIPQAPQLTKALKSSVDAGVGRYQADLAAAGGSGEYNTSWDFVGVSAVALGVRLSTRRTVERASTTSVEVAWLDQVNHRLLAPGELFTSEGWAELSSRLAKAECAGSAFRAQLVDEAVKSPDGPVRMGVAFGANGNLLVTFSPQRPVADAFDLSFSAAEASAWLSAIGRSAQQSATEPRPLESVEESLRPVVDQPQAPPVQPTKKPTFNKPAAKKPAAKKPAAKKPAAKKSAVRKPAGPIGPVDCSKLRCVALTFDDGPGPHTVDLVDKLRKANAPATFFMVGQQVDSLPGTAQVVARAGFEIANHSYTHADLTRLSAANAERQLTRTTQSIQRVTGKTPTLMRPPYGARDRSVDEGAARAGLAVVLWDADTLDWKHRDPAYVTKRALRKTNPGSIILMHDIHPTTVRAVPGLIRKLRSRGFTLVTATQLLGPTQPGSLYTHRL